jgi:oxygen-dependent protoporphyrinogen oxidase
VPTKPPRTAYVLRGGRLHALPEASILGFPTRVWPLLKSTLFSPRAKLRMGMELFVPRRGNTTDESIADFVRRRFGAEAVTYIAEPLLAGIHAGDVERLSMRALFPSLAEAEVNAGSVIRAFRRNRSRQTPGGAFRSLPGGVGELVDALTRTLPERSLCLGASVARIEANGTFRVHLRDAAPIEAKALLLCCPAYCVSDLLTKNDPAADDSLAALCVRIRYLSTATVVFAYPREAVSHPLRGTGFVVPKVERISITAGAWVSSKWPHRAPEGQVLLRAFLGGARDPDLLNHTDAGLAASARRDLTSILGIRGDPLFTRVYRWHRASPQQEVGHLALMNTIDGELARRPGLFISATGFRGVGIPDCVADARATAAAVAEYLRNPQSQSPDHPITPSPG